MTDNDGCPMIVKDEPVRPVFRRWMCDCGGEFRHSESVTWGYRTEHKHYCDECRSFRSTDEIYPGIKYVSADATVPSS